MERVRQRGLPRGLQVKPIKDTTKKTFNSILMVFAKMLGYILVGLACGFVDSALGMGFGVTSATILVTFGVNPAIASASVHAAEAVIDISLSYRPLQDGKRRL